MRNIGRHSLPRVKEKEEEGFLTWTTWVMWTGKEDDDVSHGN